MATLLQQSGQGNSSQNVTTDPSRNALTLQLLEGGTLAAFEQAATATQDIEAIVKFGLAMNAVTKHMFPARALHMQKRF